MRLLVLLITCSPAVVKAALCVLVCVCVYTRLLYLEVVETVSTVQIQIHSQIHGGIAVSEYCWFV